MQWCIDDAIGITCDDAGANGITWPKILCSSPFDHFDLTSVMVPLMTLLTWCDTDTNTNVITWQKELCCTIFWLSWLSKCSGAFDGTIGIAWCWCQWHHMTKKSCCIFFLIIFIFQMEWCHWWHCWHHGITWPQTFFYTLLNHLWPNEYSGAVDSGISIIWYWCQCQQCQMTEKVMLNLILIILN